MLVFVFKVFSETIGPTEAKFHVEPQWDRGRKFIQMIPVNCLHIVILWGRGLFAGFTTNVALQCRAFSRALEIEKLKAPLFRCPKGAGDTNDWCITVQFNIFHANVNKSIHFHLLHISLRAYIPSFNESTSFSSHQSCHIKGGNHQTPGLHNTM